MAEDTAIEWADHTFNPWEGCQKVGPGCDHCYAETRNARFGGGTAPNWGPGAPRRKTSAANWRKPRQWDAGAKAFFGKHGRRQRVFCASLADVFDNAVPDEWRLELAVLIYSTPNLDWMLLTKRIGNAEKMLGDMFPDGVPGNVWLGITVVNQPEADRDVVKLLELRKKLGIRIAFLSIEPMLGPIDLTRLRPAGYTWLNALTGQVHAGPAVWQEFEPLSLVICGGESGGGARPLHPVWPSRLRRDCADAAVFFLFKQWGEWAPHTPRAGGNLGGDVRKGKVRIVHPSGRSDVEVFEASGGRNTEPGSRYMAKVGKHAAGRELDGRTHDGMPA